MVTHPHIKLSVEVMYSDNSEVPLSLSRTFIKGTVRHFHKFSCSVGSSPESCEKIDISFVFVLQEQRIFKKEPYSSYVDN